MIDFTIKTLDSNNHEFSVDDATTVEQLKEQISTRMGIERHLQRLIFCGRVLQDEKPLAEYKVHGKVIHLVQRAPPGSNEPPPSPRRAAIPIYAATHPAANPGITDSNLQMRRLMAIGGGPNTEEQQTMRMSPTARRLDMIRRKITEIKNALAALRAHLHGQEASAATETTEAPVDTLDSEPTTAANEDVQGEPQINEDGGDLNADTVDFRFLNARGRANYLRSMRTRNSQPRDLGQLIEELDSLQEQFATYRATYVRLLRDAGNDDLPEYTDEERESNQRTVEHISDIMHSFAHAYHAVSDINFRVGQRNPRLTSESTIAHINVVRRPGRYGSPYPTNIVSSAQPENTQSFEAQQNRTNPQGRNTTQPTVNINIEPDPITYQVEIETRVPIAFALESALMSMAQQHQHTANQPTQMGQSNQASQNQPPGQPTQAEQTNYSGEHNQEIQPNQPNQSNRTNAQNQGQGRRRQLFDFENMFRDLGNASGVEVVMSMEEIPSLPGGMQGVAANLSNLGNITNLGNLGNLANLGNIANMGVIGNRNSASTGNAGNTTQTVQGAAPNIQLTEAGVTVGPITGWAGAPSADLLQNIVSSVFRQGLVPGVESLMQAHMQLTGQGAPNADGQNPANGQNATNAGQAIAQAGDQAHNQSSQAQPQIASTNGTATGQRPPGLQIRRATTTTRAHAVTLSNLAYDRFLQCDSSHARRRMARRRELHQQQMAAHEAQRVARVTAQSVHNLQNIYTNLTPDHMSLLTSLINGIPSEEACFTALMLILARFHANSDMMLVSNNQPGFMPAEFSAVRYLMREFICAMLARSRMYRDNTILSVADMLVEYNTPFLIRMSQVLHLKPDTDLVELFRSLIRSRFPAIADCVITEHGVDDFTYNYFASRFYNLFTRLITDWCALISHSCVAGVDAMRSMYWAYINETTSDFNAPMRSLINVLAEANLTHISANIPGNVDNILNELARTEDIQRNFQMHREDHQQTLRYMNQRNDMAAQLHLPTATITRPNPQEAQTGLGGENHATQNQDENRSSQSDTESSEDSLMEVSPETTQDDPMLSNIDDLPDAVDSEAPEPSAPEESSSSVPPSPSTPSGSPRNQYSPEIVPSCPHLRVTRSNTGAVATQRAAEPATNGTIENDEEESTSSSLSDDLRISPPMLILEHWGEEWVPVFTRDRTSQRATQEPCSDAYLSGMPSRKRRCVMQSRPPSSLDGLIGDSVRDVAERQPPQENPTMRLAMRAAFREHMRDLAQARATSSEDFDSSQFASAGRFLSSQMMNTSEKSDSSSESRDME